MAAHAGVHGPWSSDTTNCGAGLPRRERELILNLGSWLGYPGTKFDVIAAELPDLLKRPQY